MQKNDKITVHVPEAKELSPLDLVRVKYRSTVTQPKSDALTEEDLGNLPERDRATIAAARARRQKRSEKRKQ